MAFISRQCCSYSTSFTSRLQNTSQSRTLVPAALTAIWAPWKDGSEPAAPTAAAPAGPGRARCARRQQRALRPFPALTALPLQEPLFLLFPFTSWERKKVLHVAYQRLCSLPGFSTPLPEMPRSRPAGQRGTARAGSHLIAPASAAQNALPVSLSGLQSAPTCTFSYLRQGGQSALQGQLEKPSVCLKPWGQLNQERVKAASYRAPVPLKHSICEIR